MKHFRHAIITLKCTTYHVLLHETRDKEITKQFLVKSFEGFKKQRASFKTESVIQHSCRRFSRWHFPGSSIHEEEGWEGEKSLSTYQEKRTQSSTCKVIQSVRNNRIHIWEDVMDTKTISATNISSKVAL